MEVLRGGKNYLQTPNDGSSDNLEYFQILERQRRNFVLEILDKATKWDLEPLTKEEQEEWWRIHQILKVLPGNTVKSLQAIKVHGRLPARRNGTGWSTGVKPTELTRGDLIWKPWRLGRCDWSSPVLIVQEQFSNLRNHVELECVARIVGSKKRIYPLGGELILEGYNDASFQSDDDHVKSQSGYVFKLNGGVVAWTSSKQATTANSTTESEYIAILEAAKEAIWMMNYIQELGVVPSIVEPVVIFCDNNRAIAQVKEPRSHHQSKHILRRYHLLREMVSRGDH
ncbi:UNVERIFIED_CONTAM: hypothetical protein Slati_3942800 [Sesamum latifolium]|uniref:Uncharacterized protein n=1 Tax=Sesamum latifolium TaxID=2727402 RepID=A0AAW2TP83_9LAMI